MSSGKELNFLLDKLPPSPYKQCADLRELHRLLHKAAEADDVPYGYNSLTTQEELLDFVNSIRLMEPTNLAKALELINVIEREIFTSDYPEGPALDVLKLALHIYVDHYPPERINHRF